MNNCSLKPYSAAIPTQSQFKTHKTNSSHPSNQHFTLFGVGCQADLGADLSGDTALNLAFEWLDGLPDEDWGVEFPRTAKRLGIGLQDFRSAYHSWQAARLAGGGSDD
jgi:hypothetical protein